MSGALEIDAQAFELDIDVQSGVFVPEPPFVSIAHDFDGSNDFMIRGADLTGNVDAKVGIGAMCVRLNGDGTSMTLYANQLQRVRFSHGADDTFRLFLADTTGASKVNITTPVILSSSTWLCILFAWDLSSPIASENSAYIYINGVQEAAVETIDNAAQTDIDSTGTDHTIGALFAAGFEKADVCLAEVFLHYGATLDLTVEANQRLFYDVNNKPVDKGNDGSGPLGEQPLIYYSLLTGPNKGKGGDFVITGALDICSTSPTD